MEERRKTIRRESDRQLMEKITRLQKAGDGGKAERRKRRHAIRHTCNVTIEVLIGHAAGNSEEWSVDGLKIAGRLLDLSADGASLFTKHNLETGQELRLAIDLHGKSTINTMATVRWLKAIPEKGGYASGTQFGHVSDKDRKALTKFLEELDRTAGL